MIYGLLFVMMVCWIPVAIMVFIIAGAYSTGRQTDAYDFLLSSERIHGRISIFCRADSFDFYKIHGQVVLTRPVLQQVMTTDRSVTPKYAIDEQKR